MPRAKRVQEEHVHLLELQNRQLCTMHMVLLLIRLRRPHELQDHLSELASLKELTRKLYSNHDHD